MDETLVGFISNNALAFGVAALIFFITLFFAVKQWIGFSMGVLFLMFAWLSGLTLANYDLIRSYLEGSLHDSFKSADLKTALFQEQVLNKYDGLKAEVEVQKHQIRLLSEKE